MQIVGLKRLSTFLRSHRPEEIAHGLTGHISGADDKRRVVACDDRAVSHDGTVGRRHDRTVGRDRRAVAGHRLGNHRTVCRHRCVTGDRAVIAVLRRVSGETWARNGRTVIVVSHHGTPGVIDDRRLHNHGATHYGAAHDRSTGYYRAVRLI